MERKDRSRIFCSVNNKIPRHGSVVAPQGSLFAIFQEMPRHGMVELGLGYDAEALLSRLETNHNQIVVTRHRLICHAERNLVCVPN